jgi:peptide/nickel transport system substrate-binding protein
LTHLRFAICALLLALVTTAVAEEPRRGGILTMTLSPEPVSLNSAADPSNAAALVSTKVLEGLLGYDFDLNPVPRLATSWLVAPDGRSITFRLRPGVKWHDGADFTSADVAFSLMQVWKVLHPRGRASFAAVTQVETPDPLIAVLRLSAPAPALLAALSAFEAPVLPKHVYAGAEIAGHPRNVAPIGTGPFRFKDWRRGQAILLERNPDYWDRGKPYLEGIEFRILTGGTNRASAFETGEALIGAFNPVPLNEVERLDKLPHLDIETRGYEALAPMYLAQLNLRNRQLADKRVRQALAHAVDRTALARNVWFGFAVPATGPVPSSQRQWYEEDVPRYAFDPKRAEQLLDEAGLARGSDGKRFKLVLDYLPLGADHRRTAEFLRQQLARVGIEAEVRDQDLPSFVRRVYTDGDFDLALGYFYALADPTLGLQRLYWSKGAFRDAPFGNASRYANAEMDRVLEAIQSESEPLLRRALIGRMQRLAQEDLPTIDLFELRFFTLYNRRVRSHTVDAEGPCGNFAETWLAR